MKQLGYFFSFMAAVILFTSCDGAGGLFTATGTTNEVLVIMDETEWEEGAGRALFDVLNSNAKALPQPEANFRIIQIAPEHFTATFKMTRNIIIPEISEIYSQPKLKADIDKYATGQVIMKIHAPDSAGFSKFVTENRESIVEYFIQKELERRGKWLRSEMKAPVATVKKVFGIDIHFPRGLGNVSQHKNFYWATNNTPSKRQDIVVYQFPYTSETVFEKESLIAMRNKILGEYIKGSFDSQMTTAAIYDPDYRKIEVDGIFRAELRGLWEMTNDMMGGPFVMHALVNQNTGMVVVVETFVYAPESNKRNLMRNLEATLYTIDVSEAKTKKS